MANRRNDQDQQHGTFKGCQHFKSIVNVPRQGPEKRGENAPRPEENHGPKGMKPLELLAAASVGQATQNGVGFRKSARKAFGQELLLKQRIGINHARGTTGKAQDSLERMAQ